jgi:hypothetical protein
VIGLIIIVVLAVIGIDAIWVCCRLRLRARAAHHQARRPSSGLGPQGWHSISRIGEVTGIAEAGEVEAIEDDPGSESPRRGASRR